MGAIPVCNTIAPSPYHGVLLAPRIYRQARAALRVTHFLARVRCVKFEPNRTEPN